MTDIDTMVAEYIKRRDQLAEIEAQAKAASRPIKEELELIEAALQKTLLAQGAKSVRTPHGTVYTSEVLSTKVVDWEATLAYIKANDAFYLLEKRVSKTAIKETGEVVPGIECNTVVNLNVRRS